MEYNYLLDMACIEQDENRRIALVAAHIVTTLTICEKTTTKPFNPLLGETYEFVNDDFQYLAEQVSHHPPITACYCKGKKSNYVYFTNQKTNIKFSGKSLLMRQQYLAYVDLPDFNERYEISLPEMSLHNFVIGTPFIDIGETLTVTKMGTPLSVIIDFTRRGWFAKEKDIAKFAGNVVTVDESTKKKKVLEKHMAIYGNWDRSMYLQKPGEQEELIWTKNPYPEQFAYMYGMSHFSLQMNYFPKRLDKVIPPTDTRRRPD